VTPDISTGISKGWEHHDASLLERDMVIEADVAVIGTGAGGGLSAEIFAKSGLKVVMIEEGPLKTYRDFHLLESEAYPHLYQESASRKTKDKGIEFLQGRCVGGSTTVNWTTSIRTPIQTLEYWRDIYDFKGYGMSEIVPWFELAEERFNVTSWDIPPNENNDVLRRGAEKLGISFDFMKRNVKKCLNIGYCGLGCPVSARQSVDVTSIPSAMEKGAILLSRARAERLNINGGKVKSVTCVGMDRFGTAPGKHKVTVVAREFVLSGGAIGTPALLLRSKAPDPHAIIGKRTFLHPVSISIAQMPDRVDGWSGAPQSVYSDHFNFVNDGRMEYKLEMAPVHPVLAATKITGYGKRHKEHMKNLPYAQVIIALNKDGFHRESPGGYVELNRDGTPVLNYPITDYLWDGLRRSLLSSAEIQFAAGAKMVLPLHEDSFGFRSWSEAKNEIPKLEMSTLRARVASAHVMGGCPMGASEKTSLLDFNGKYRFLDNLHVFDGSIYPTSLGANPQLTIFAVTMKQATELTKEI